MSDALPLGDKGLTNQGYDFAPDELHKLDWGLRFTPTVCMLAAVYGLFTQQPLVHYIIGASGVWSFFMPSHHPLDLVYNYAVRHLWGGVALPPNPLPRRIACLVGGSFNIAIGLGFTLGNPTLSYVLGGMLIPLQIIVVSTHFCAASWIYEGVLRLLGKWTVAIPVSEARELIASGARLIDVREPDEFVRGHIEGAENVPLDTVLHRYSEFAEHKVILYCASGLRCQNAAQQLRRRGLSHIYNFGAMSRWSEED